MEATPVETEVAPVAATPEVAPAPAPETPAAPPPPSLLDEVKQLGFADVKDERDATGRLFSDYKRLREEQDRWQQERETLSELARYGREHLETLRKGAQPQPEQASEHPWWKAPKFSPELADRYRDVKLGTNGEQEIVWKENTPAEVRAAADAYQAHIQQWHLDLLTRPHEVLPEIIRHEAQKIIQDFYQERTQEQTEQQFVDGFKRENAWIYETDPRTQQPLVDPFTGQVRYSAEGQKLVGLMQEAQDIGIASIKGQLQYAKRLYDATQPAPVQAQPAASLAQTAAQKRQESARRASRAVAQRTGSEPEVTERPRTQNRHKSMGELVLESMHSDGGLVPSA